MTWENVWSKPYTVEKTVHAVWGEKPTLTLTNGNKQYTFTAEIIGDLALDFTPDDQPNAGWNIYHVPTLACFSKAVPSYVEHSIDCPNKNEPHILYCKTTECDNESFNYSREALLIWMAKVQKNYPTSWTMLRLLTPDNYADKAQHAKDILLKWCLSVPVVEE